MGIEKLTDRQIASIIERYRKLEKAEGGPYSLVQLITEQRSRIRSPFPVVEVARTILEMSRKSRDGLVTYKQIWSRFRPSEEWKGHASQRPVRDSLYRVIDFCAVHELPIITVLVVRTATRKLSDDAIHNIFNECRELGLNVGNDPCEFVRRETERSLQMGIEELPSHGNE